MAHKITHIIFFATMSTVQDLADLYDLRFDEDEDNEDRIQFVNTDENDFYLSQDPQSGLFTFEHEILTGELNWTRANFSFDEMCVHLAYLVENGVL